MYQLFRPVLFRFAPERVHEATLYLLNLIGRLTPLRTLLSSIFSVSRSPVDAFGLTFANPLGLAAGYDKDGLAWRGLASLGFGHIEIGTITPRPQPGNPRPRIFRLVEDRALINRMGFPGRGADFVAKQLQSSRPNDLIVGANLGINKDTHLDHAVEDYLILMRVLSPLADYLAINVSSPNTLGLRRLQAKEALNALLSTINQERREHEVSLGKSIPVLVKLSPDLSQSELDDALDVILSTEMDGVIATNTTTQREGLKSKFAHETGGLSGEPLSERSTQVVRWIYQRTMGKVPIIGSGGVMRTSDVQAKLDAGAVLVQVYTGLVYNGPGFVKRVFSEIKGY